jgi:hypothetical protein
MYFFVSFLFTLLHSGRQAACRLFSLQDRASAAGEMGEVFQLTAATASSFSLSLSLYLYLSISLAAAAAFVGNMDVVRSAGESF